MDQNERQVIDGLFDKLRQVEQQAPQREAEAEALIRERVAAQPGAPYYMAQAMLVQEQALASLQQRTQELERELATRPAAGGGSFLSGLFGGQGQPAAPARPAARAMAPGVAGRGMGAGGYGTGSPWGGQGGAWGGRPGGGGGGFLAGAMQTAVGVAGGVLVASALSSAFSGGEEAVSGLAEDAGNVADEATAPFEDPGMQDAAAPEEFDAGGDFGDESV